MDGQSVFLPLILTARKIGSSDWPDPRLVRKRQSAYNSAETRQFVAPGSFLLLLRPSETTLGSGFTQMLHPFPSPI